MEQVKGLKIRPMADGDLSAITEMDRKVAGKERMASWPQKASSHFRTYYPPLSFVAEMDGKVVGFIIGVVMGAEHSLPLSGWMSMMGVAPEYQGRGIAHKLVGSFIEGCHQRGIKARAMVQEGDERLQKFLGSFGFRKGDRVEFVRGFD